MEIEIIPTGPEEPGSKPGLSEQPAENKPPPKEPPLHKQGGSCLTVLGLWVLVFGTMIGVVAALVVYFSWRRSLAPTDTGGEAQVFPCEDIDCAASMRGPSRWSPIPAMKKQPGVLLGLSGGNEHLAFLAIAAPAPPEMSLDSLIDNYLKQSKDARPGYLEIRRLDMPVGDEKHPAIQSQVGVGKERVEGFTVFVRRDETFFVLLALADIADFPAREPELRAAIKDFRIPPPLRPDEKPAVRLKLPKPPPPGEQSDDLPERLADTAYLMGAQNPERAAVLLRLAIDKGLTRGEYDLACYEARQNHVDSALYWLQQAALDNGVDPDWAEEDADLASLRADPRWLFVQGFLGSVARYWAHNVPPRQIVTVPERQAPPGGRPVLIGMHGLGATPENFTEGWATPIADRTGTAILSMSGTKPFGPNSFSWAEEPWVDWARIKNGLDAVNYKVNPARGKLITIGFSQGAQMAVEIAAREPKMFAGAIVMSPGGRRGLHLQDVADPNSLRGKRFVIVIGAGEHPGNLELARKDAARLRELGADVYHHEYANQTTHTFPPDFEQALPRWIAFILSGPRP